jgi:hypothetical protein
MSAFKRFDKKINHLCQSPQMRDWVTPSLLRKIETYRKFSPIKLKININKTGRLKEFEIIDPLIEIPTEDHKRWLTKFFEDKNAFDVMRLICNFCGKKITDDIFAMIPSNDDPDEYIYLHGLGKCDARTNKALKAVGDKWSKNKILEKANELVNSPEEIVRQITKV